MGGYGGRGRHKKKLIELGLYFLKTAETLPSMLARYPAGSSKVHFCKEAFSMLAQSIRTPRKRAPSRTAPEKSARSKLQYDKLAPFMLQPRKMAYLDGKDPD